MHCWAGISRSTAPAYAALAQAYGPGYEHEALAEVARVRPKMLPNLLIVAHAAAILGRSALLFPAQDFTDAAWGFKA